MVASRADLFVALGGSALLHAAVLFGVQISAAPHQAAAQTTAHLTLTAHLESAQRHATPNRINVARPVVNHAVPDQPAELSVVEATPLASSAETIENKTDYYSTDQLDFPPRMLGEVQQIYPLRARSAAIEGFVTVALLINEHGGVDDISVTQEQPQGYFEEAALTMLRQQRFTPALKQNQAVKSRWLTTVRYRLQNSL